MVIVIDGINQINADYDAQKMSWLPATLPDGVRLVVTCSDGDVMNNYIQNCDPLQHQLLPLSEEDSKDLVRIFLKTFHKKLCEDDGNYLLGNQMEILMDKEEANLPLYLLAAASELVTFGVYEKVCFVLDTHQLTFLILILIFFRFTFVISPFLFNVDTTINIDYPCFILICFDLKDSVPLPPLKFRLGHTLSSQVAGTPT